MPAAPFLPIKDPEPTEAELKKYWPGIRFTPGVSSKVQERICRFLAKAKWELVVIEKEPDAFLVPFVEDIQRYNEYLKSPEWNRIKGKVLRLHNYQCACCGNRANQVHHRDYRPRVLRGEDMNALVPICKRCHDHVEKARKGKDGRGNWQAGERVLADLLHRQRDEELIAASPILSRSRRAKVHRRKSRA